MKSFFFVVILGAGVGLTTSANSLALNTYFKERRRIVTGISWSCTALGPICFPYIVTILLPYFGVQGTVLIFSGIALNAVCCSLLLQPVRWHVKNKKLKDDSEDNLIDRYPEIECPFCQSLKKKSHSVMSSQYIHNVDDCFTPGYEIIDPGTPMMARANDGWYSSSSAKRSLYGSKMSLSSKKVDSIKASNQNLTISSRPSYANLAAVSESKPKRAKEIRSEAKIEEVLTEDCPSHKSPQDLKQHLTVKSIRNYKTSPTTPTNNPPFYIKKVSESKYLKDNKSNRSMLGGSQMIRKQSNTFNIEKEILNIARNRLEQYMIDANDLSVDECNCEKVKESYIRNLEVQKQMEEEQIDEKHEFTLWQKIFIFFDLDLLKDFTYINIMIGVTIANFAELNFSVLTPFVLAELHGLSTSQIALCMSLLGMTDISVRFFIPFIAGFIGWENRTFFLFGVLGMALGRVGE